MDTFAPLSPTTFAPPAPFDGSADRSWPEWLADAGGAFGRAPAATFDPVQRSGLSEVFSAAERQTRLVQNSAWHRARMEEVYDETIDQVRKATGVRLDNPVRSWAGIGQGVTDISSAPGQEPTPLEKAETEFRARLAELKRQFPDALAALDPAMDVEALGNQAAAIAEGDANAQNGRTDLNGFLKGASALAGSLYGARKDPITYLSMLAGVGGSAAKTLGGRIVGDFVRQGTLNAGLTSLAEPSIQQGRAAAGLEHGWREGVTDIGMSFLSGGLIGGGVRAGAELPPMLARLLAGTAGEADFAAARAAGLHISPETEQAYRGARFQDEADAAMRVARPETVPEHAADSQLTDGIFAANDPTAPAPLVDPPISAATNDDLARRLTADATSPTEAADRLRSDPAAIASALASEDPALRDTGRLATLDDVILDKVRAGDVDAAHAAIVAATTSDPVQQASALAAIAEARPTSPADVRTVVSDHVAAARAPSSAIAATLPFGPRIDATAETFLEAIAHARALGRGEVFGALQHPELGAISIPLGDKRLGILHIEDKHPEVRLADLPTIIARAQIKSRTPHRISLSDGRTEIALKMAFDDIDLGRRWVVTAFEPDGRRTAKGRKGRDGRPEAHPSQASVSQAGADDLPPPTPTDVQPGAANINAAASVPALDLVPIIDESGAVRFATRDALTQVAERESWMSDVVAACKT